MDSASDQKNLGNVIGGHKANLHNPNTSEEAKQHSREVLEELGLETGSYTSGPSSADVNIVGKNPGNVAGGYKATLHNPNVSEEAKERAQEKLEKLEKMGAE
ncbi:hypothetical protein C7212DRAFT_361654 [Tuber magnatum]|uniref:Conidiation protein 6 n=1 Tax=Tuber magnatum TaxID=42249 RepID=A0A317SYV9_9PEZI|nr:hypothetical protein C7212DRAFT_361654 [Tuber magnatum]